MEQILFSGISADQFFLRLERIVEAKISTATTPTKEISDYLSRKDIAALLKISLPTVDQWTKQGLLYCYKMGNRVFYKRQEVERSLHEVMYQKHKKLKQC